MKKILSLALLATVSVLALGYGRPTSYNLVLDPSFENTNHPNWDNSMSGVYYTNGNYYTGPYGSVLAENTGHSGVDCWNFWVSNQPENYTAVS